MAKQKLGVRADGKPDRRFYFTYFDKGHFRYEVVVGKDTLAAAARKFRSEYPDVQIAEAGELTHGVSLRLQRVLKADVAAVKREMRAHIDQLSELAASLDSEIHADIVLKDLTRLRNTVDRYVT